jgi:hypothetical protein
MRFLDTNYTTKKGKFVFQEQQTIASQNVKMLLALTANRQVKGMP